MVTEIARVTAELVPEKTVLFFGSGASISSHAPSVASLMEHLAESFNVPNVGYTLREYTSILEDKFGRKRLIEELRKLFSGLKPTGSLLNLPLYRWKSIYTTNYDSLIESAYDQKEIDFALFQSNRDFTVQNKPNSVSIFKLHGSIGLDITDGHEARIILTDSDYDHTQSFREGLYDRLKADLHGTTMVIIGHSLADEHIKEIANRQAELSAKSGGLGRVVLLIYQRDEDRAKIWERRGFQVVFGGMDDFILAMTRVMPKIASAAAENMQLLDYAPRLQVVTLDAAHASMAAADVTGMFNGWPASYADIKEGLTFERGLTPEIEFYLNASEGLCAVILGASGVGKTTTARQVSRRLLAMEWHCWEHKSDFDLPARDWITVATMLQESGKKGLLIVDDGHSHLYEINTLVDGLIAANLTNLKIIISSTRNHWNPRVKTPGFFKVAKEFLLGRLKTIEVDKLLNLVDSSPRIRALVEESFSGFSRYERRRRLIERCESETFVCLKNVFASEKFDDIILREYAGLSTDLQDVYKHVAVMESSGIKVHRQLIIRLLGIPADFIGSVLTNLTDIIHEYPIDERQGVYGWRGRHGVIASILTKYKYPEIETIIDLFEKVIDSISPTYDIEIRTIRELCNLESGIPRIADKSIQNRLLRKMMSYAPAERVPRHRLIRNLIKMGEFEKADAEIRIFEKDFGRDAPVARYRINCLIARAVESVGILDEDRFAILIQARDLAQGAANRYPDNKLILGAYCEVGVQLYRRTKDYSVYDAALKELKGAEIRVGDPQISVLVRKYEQRFSGQATHVLETATADI